MEQIETFVIIEIRLVHDTRLFVRDVHRDTRSKIHDSRLRQSNPCIAYTTITVMTAHTTVTYEEYTEE